MLKSRLSKALVPLVVGVVALTGLMVLIGSAVALVRHDAVQSRDNVWKVKLGDATANAKQHAQDLADAQKKAEDAERARQALDTANKFAAVQRAQLEDEIARLKRETGNPLLYKAEKPR